MGVGLLQACNGPTAASISMQVFSSGKALLFQGMKTPPFRTSDPTVQSSVGPTVRSYTRDVHILQTLFITEFREPAAQQSPVKKKSRIFSREMTLILQGNDPQSPGK